jgi:Flp pilus assembly protein TadD
MSTGQYGGRHGRRLVSGALALFLAAGVAGCAQSRMTTGSVPASSPEPIGQMTSSQLNAALAQLGPKYAADPKNKAIALSYASALQIDGRTDQSLAVMRKAVIYHPKDRDVLAAYGKALAADGQLEQALDAIRRAETPEYPDWRLVSAEGAILDQLGQTDQARELYHKALDLKPNEPSVLSNLGISYLLKGDLKSAETYLRSANGQSGADSRIRQNLALVVGLQGRFDEAQKIASADLPPDEAAANVAYLRQMISQQNAWSQLKDDKKKKTAN